MRAQIPWGLILASFASSRRSRPDAALLLHTAWSGMLHGPVLAMQFFRMIFPGLSDHCERYCCGLLFLRQSGTTRLVINWKSE